jgi:hypothetical protein
MLWMRHDPSSDYGRKGFMSKSADKIANEILEMDPEKSCVLDMSECPRTLEEIGQAMGLTRERVRQIENGTRKNGGGAINRLRHRTRTDYLKDFIGEGERRGPDVRVDDWNVRLKAEG